MGSALLRTTRPHPTSTWRPLAVPRQRPSFANGRCACGASPEDAGPCRSCAAKAIAGSERGAPYQHDFSRIAVLPPATDRLAPRLFDGQTHCSPETYGSTDPEIDKDGSFTGEVVVTINDAAIKSPCVRDCVVAHEEVHRRDLTPILKKIHACDVAARNDPKKQGECNALSNAELPKAQHQTECNAYRASYTCLTAKLLDSSSPCSKSPHREEIQKHRGYEACELKNQCKEAGRPNEGIPNA
ncbi:MAG: hypothetical protein QM820_22000 [Minicystis sp.]